MNDVGETKALAMVSHEIPPGDIEGLFMSFMLAFAIVGLLFLYNAYKLLKKARLHKDLQTSKIRSIALGTVELKGKIAEWNSIRSPIAGEMCVYFRYLISKQHDKSWHILAGFSSLVQHFFLEDGSGKVLVDSKGARIEVLLKTQWISGIFRPLPPHVKAFLSELDISPKILGVPRTLRFQEWQLKTGKNVYVVGECKDNRTVHYHTTAERELIANEKVVVGYCTDDEHTFLISEKQEMSIIQQSENKGAVSLILGILLFVCSVVGILLQIMFPLLLPKVLSFWLLYLVVVHEFLS